MPQKGQFNNYKTNNTEQKKSYFNKHLQFSDTKLSTEDRLHPRQLDPFKITNPISSGTTPNKFKQ